MNVTGNYHAIQYGQTDGEEEWVVEVRAKESTTRAVIRGIAAIKGVADTDLEPLYESIETNALNNLIQHADDHACSVCAEFTFEGFTLLVGLNDEVRIVNYIHTTMSMGSN